MNPGQAVESDADPRARAMMAAEERANAVSSGLVLVLVCASSTSGLDDPLHHVPGPVRLYVRTARSDT